LNIRFYFPLNLSQAFIITHLGVQSPLHTPLKFPISLPKVNKWVEVHFPEKVWEGFVKMVRILFIHQNFDLAVIQLLRVGAGFRMFWAIPGPVLSQFK
jgi:hypothetical protein